MKQTITQDDDGNDVLEFDLDGIDYFIEGLEHLKGCAEGTTLSTPSMWEEPAPWWRFWNRSSRLMTGEFRIRLVEDP